MAGTTQQKTEPQAEEATVPAVASVTGDEATEEVLPPLTLAEAVESIDDGSRMEAGTTVEEAVELIAGLAQFVVQTHRSATEAARKTASAIAHHARRLVLLPNGAPDWSGMSPLSETILTYSLDKVLNGEMAQEKGERSKVRKRVMQHVRATYLELEIRDYVAKRKTLEGEPLFENGEPDDSNPMFLAEVRKQYLGSGLAVPAKYQSPEEKDAARGATGESGPKNPGETVRRGVEALQFLTPEYRAARILQAVSDLVAEIQTGDVKGIGTSKAAVAELLNRTSMVALHGAKVLDGVSKGGDSDTAAAAMYDPEHDDPARQDDDQS